jgi:hypothetical protein
MWSIHICMLYEVYKTVSSAFRYHQWYQPSFSPIPIVRQVMLASRLSVALRIIARLYLRKNCTSSVSCDRVSSSSCSSGGPRTFSKTDMS